MAKLDRSSETIVVWCPHCPLYSRFFMRSQELWAYREACQHELLTHPNQRVSRNAYGHFLRKSA
ncbi:hypothetical protein C5D44_00215 [Rathayibacter sp. AY1B5]|nr:hypothetical protein C5D44_00215 [Rathayibacter sp. AY1B5]